MSYESSGSFPNYGATTSDSSPSRSSEMMRYNQLSDVISSSIFAINNNVAAIEKGFKQIATPSDTVFLRDKVQKTIHETSSRASETAICIKELSALVQNGDKTQRLQLERLKNEFTETIQRFSSLQKQVATKMKYSQPAKPQSKPAASSSIWVDDDDVPEEKLSLMEEEKRMQRQKQLEADLEFEQAYYQEREQRIGQITNDMDQVNQIMRDLAAMVHQQAEPIQNIEANVERASSNVHDGRDQLVKASEYQKKARQKMCIFIVLLLIVGAVLAIILYFSLK